MSDTLKEKVKALEVENQKLRCLLESHGISLADEFAVPSSEPKSATTRQKSYSVNKKIAIFRSPFRGRIDVYPVRWSSQKSRKSGYSPACANEWRSGVCAKPRVKCAECNNRSLLPVTDETIYSHLSGKITIGVYPLLFEENNIHYQVNDKRSEREEIKVVFTATLRQDQAKAVSSIYSMSWRKIFRAIA